MENDERAVNNLHRHWALKGMREAICLPTLLLMCAFVGFAGFAKQSGITLPQALVMTSMDGEPPTYGAGLVSFLATKSTRRPSSWLPSSWFMCTPLPQRSSRRRRATDIVPLGALAQTAIGLRILATVIGFALYLYFGSRIAAGVFSSLIVLIIGMLMGF